MNSRKSNSVDSSSKVHHRFGEWLSHFQMRWQGRGEANNIATSLNEQLSNYEKLSSLFGSQELAKSKVLEIGYGARPLRMFWMLSHRIDVTGIDLDRPVLRGMPGEFLEMYRKNGIQRVLKSLIRHFVFDRQEWARLSSISVSQGGLPFRFQPERFLVGDASKFDFRPYFPDGADFIYCEDVLEHVPRDDIPILLRSISGLLKPDGWVLLRPFVYTSICGSHLTEWYPHLTRARMEDDDCRSEPWEHLRRKRFRANTYLNELRLGDYRSLISESFTIVSESFHDPELGRRYLTKSIEAELSGFSREELLANTVGFVCKKK